MMLPDGSIFIHEGQAYRLLSQHAGNARVRNLHTDQIETFPTRRLPTMPTMTASLISPSGHSLLAPQLDYILLDGSGSMLGQWWEVQAALESYLRDLRAGNLNAHLILSTFDNQAISLVQRDCRLAEMVPLRDDPITANFSTTPLYDAISTAGWTFRDLDPPRGTLLIATDGDENASTFTTLEQAKAVLDWMRAKGWQVIFFGCDFNNSHQARALGANPDTAIGVQKALLSDAAAMLAKKRSAYGLYGSPMHFTTDEQTQFGGFLSAPQED